MFGIPRKRTARGAGIARPLLGAFLLFAASAAAAQSIELRPWSAMAPLRVGEPTDAALIVHFAASADAAEASRAKAFAMRAPEIAGARHVFVLPAMSEGEMDSAARKAAWDGVDAYLDSSENSLVEQWKAGAGTAVALSAAGKEAFRLNPRNGAPASFDDFAQRFERATAGRVGKHQNVDGAGLALQGYDPVAYFDGKAAKGRDGIRSRHEGATYRFATLENRARFAANPKKYAPEYGGWCATAMAEGDKVEVDPESFKITNGRLFLFYNGFWGDALKAWNKDEENLTTNADSAWRETVSK